MLVKSKTCKIKQVVNTVDISMCNVIIVAIIVFNMLSVLILSAGSSPKHEAEAEKLTVSSVLGYHPRSVPTSAAQGAGLSPRHGGGEEPTMGHDLFLLSAVT